jgi:thiol:disulfide interchange protein
MTNYLKLIVLSIILMTGLSSCKAESQNNGEKDIIYSVDSDSLTSGNPAPGEWLTNYQQALNTAQKENKQVFVNFTGSDWCIWCKRLNKEVLTQKPFIDYAHANYTNSMLTKHIY